MKSLLLQMRPHPRPLPVGEGTGRAAGGAAILSGIIAGAIVFLCCALPLLWIVWQILTNPTTLREMHLDAFRIGLLGRTLLYNFCVGAIATLLALPAAWVLGRGRGIVASAMWFVLPISLLMPSLVLAYGWKQFIRLLGFEPMPQGFWDVSRCIWSLATWLWPVPAMVVGLALRRADPQVQQQALLDGVLRRVMLRQVIGPIVASACVVSLLAMQEFAVYEPTGISVVATEVRMVFDTGAHSSSTNPITQPMGAAGASGAAALGPDQRARAAAAVATAMPMLGVVAILAIVALLGVRKLSAAEHLDIGAWPRSLDAPAWAALLGWFLILLALFVPIAALVLSLRRPFNPANLWEEFSPQISGTLQIASIAGAVACLLGFAAVPRRSRGLKVASIVSIASFLIGGQILAIGMIRLYNHHLLSWAYEGWPVIVMAYIGRFGWIVLSAAAVTWSAPWRQIRDLAAVDGATPMQAATQVIWPLAWPILGASAMFVLILSLSEVPATVLISPQRPQMLVPMLMTWLHMLRYDSMIECSLLTAGIVVVLGAAALVMGRIGLRFVRLLPVVLICVLLSSCRDGTKPEAIWCSTGVGPAQVVYPRGIAYDAFDDSFYIVDREARIQHLDRDGKFLAAWRTPAWAQGKPVGLTVGPDKNLYVADTHYHRVLVYSPDGELLRQWGEKGTGPGQFIYPTDIAFDSKGNVFVSEYGDNDRIQVFNPKDGRFLYTFGTFGDAPGQFSRPQSIVIDNDLIYVADSCNHRLEVFKTDGTFVRTMGKVGSGPGEFRFPYGMDDDGRGHLVVCEFGNNRVQLIDKQSGKGLAVWGMAGREPGELAYPWGVAVDKHDRVVAVDAGNNRLQVFEF